MAIVILGSGFIGSYLIHRLDCEVKVLFHSKVPEYLGSNVKAFVGDVKDKELLLSIIDERDVVVNLVRTGSDWKKCVRNVVEVCEEKKAKRLVHFSSCVVYGDGGPFNECDELNPKSDYAKKKYGEEMIVKESKIPVIVLRPSTVYGVGGRGFINILLQLCKGPRKIVVNNQGKPLRDFVFIDDVIDCVIKVLDYEGSGVFNISTGVGTSLIDVVSYIKKYVPDLEVMFNKEPVFEEMKMIIGNGKAKRLLGFSPRVDVYKGLDLLFSEC